MNDFATLTHVQDHLFTTEQRIISWKPTAPLAYKINIDAHSSEDCTYAVGAAVVCDAEFNWFLGVTVDFRVQDTRGVVNCVLA